MKSSVITKVLKKVNSNSEKYSLGFKRLMALPLRVRKSFDLAANLQTNWDGKTALDNQIKFLNDLSDGDFINWLKTA